MTGKVCRQTVKGAKENPNFFNLKWANREYTGERCFEIFDDMKVTHMYEEPYKEVFNEMLRNYISKVRKTNK